jgi:hypothetical protein
MARTVTAPNSHRELHPRFGQPEAALARLQSKIGNQAVMSSLSWAAPKIQTRLMVNHPGDRSEREADNVAAQVMRMPCQVSMQSCPSQSPIPWLCRESALVAAPARLAIRNMITTVTNNSRGNPSTLATLDC